MTPRLKCWLWRGFLWVHWEKTVRQGVLSHTWYTRDCSNWHPVHTFPGWNTLTSAFLTGLGTGAHWSFVRRKRKISYCFKPKFPMDGIPGILFRGWFPDETKMFVTVNPVTWSGCNSASNLAHTSSTWASVGSLFFGISSNKDIKGGKPPFQSTQRQAHPFSNVQGCLKGYNHWQKS